MKRFCCLFVVLIASSFHALSAGFIVLHGIDYWPYPHPHPPPLIPPVPPPRPAPDAPIELRNLQAKVRIEDQIARTTLEHEFYNPNPRQLEGTFLFPVPKGAQLDRFAMEINGQTVEAELLAADKARKIYEDIVRARKDPALLEYADRDVYKVRVFPILPQAKQKLTVSYTQLLTADAGLISYVLPLAGQSSPGQMSVDLDLRSRTPLKALYSPSHPAEIKRTEDRHAHLAFESARGERQRDFQLMFSQDEAPLGVNLLTHRTGDEEGYFLLLLNASLDKGRVKTVAKDILFVLDASGSMAGPKLEQAKKALLFCVENLEAEDRFDIIRFSTEVDPLFGKLAEADDGHRNQARTFINGIKPTGGTAIAAALDRALSARPADTTRPFHVIFLTDGLPTVGVTDPEQIVRGVNKETNTRIFCFGIGTDVNTHLLDKIAETTRAVSQYVLPEEDLELKISSFYSKIKEPALTSPELVFPEGVRVSKLYPSPLPDLFKGQQLVVVGRYQGSDRGKLTLKGKSNQDAQTYQYDLEFGKDSAEHDFLPRLWAMRRVGFLLDEIRLHGENQELKDEATELARRYGIVTPYTAYLILEDERRRDVPTSLRTLPELERNISLGREIDAAYKSFASDSKGEGAVAGSRLSQTLRLAQAPESALQSVNVEAARAATAPALQTADSFRVPVNSPAQQRRLEQLSEQAQNYTQQAQFVSGRTFYQNKGQWTDKLSQNARDMATREVKFGSDEYFALAAAHPEALAWLSLGTNVSFVLKDTKYTIHE